MKFSFAIYVFVLAFVTLSVDAAAKKKLHPSVIPCKRYDPNISKCFKDNFVRLLPLMRNGLPEMNIAPLEPVHVENVRMDFPATQSVSLGADLKKMNVWGIGDTALVDIIIGNSSTNTLDMYMHFTIPKISIVSDYKAVGKILLLAIDTYGNFSGEFEGLDIKMNWTSERFMKKGNEHFKSIGTVDELTIKKLKIHFNNLFGNNTELTENTNKVINENIGDLYAEVSPVIRETIRSVAMNTVNNVFFLFPIDVLYPIH